jgi:hypothetical protein
VGWLRGEYEEATRWAGRSRELYQRLGDRQGLISARNEFGIVARQQEDYGNARHCFEANLALAREIGDRFGMAQALHNLGEVGRGQGAYDEARAWYEQALATHVEIYGNQEASLALLHLGLLCTAQGQDAAAWDYLLSSLRGFLARRLTPVVLNTLVGIAHLHVRADQPEQGAELLGLALRHPASDAKVERDAAPVMAALRVALPAEELESAMARGAQLDLDQVVAEILGADGER